MQDFPIVPPLVIKDTPKPQRLTTLSQARAYVDEAMRLGRPEPWRELWHRLKSVTSEEDAIEAIGDMRELLAEEAINESSTTYFATIFESTQRHQKFAPSGQIGFASQHIAEDDPVALEQHPRSGFEGTISFGGLIGVEEGPTTGAVPGTGRAPAALAGATLGIDERAQIVEAVGRNDSGGHQFPERGLNFRFQLGRSAHNVSEKRGATLAQEFEHLPGIMT